MFRTIALFATTLALGGAAYSAPQRQDRDLAPAARAACLAKGGVVQRAGLAGFERCTLRYADAGKACRGKKDCLGRCLLDAKHPPRTLQANARLRSICEATDNSFGCQTLLENGRNAGTICID